MPRWRVSWSCATRQFNWHQPPWNMDTYTDISRTGVGMGFLSDFFHRLHNLDDLIAWGGLVVLMCIVYAETGLLVGFFLPGDSLLVTAGVYAATHPQQLSITTMILCLACAAIAGDNTGY